MKNTKLWIALLINISFCCDAFNAAAQKNRSEALTIIKAFPDYKEVARVHNIGILPLESCFDCDKMKIKQLKRLGKQGNLLLIYPATREIVQEKVKKAAGQNQINAAYIFDDALYKKFFDVKLPKGYFISMR